MSRPVNRGPRKKVAIVGSGCAGLAALWALNRSHHDVYIYEADQRLGGHTNTVEWAHGKYKTLVDTGFIVMNQATYREQATLLDPNPTSTPCTACLANSDAANFINFLKKIRVDIVPTLMTFGVSRDHGYFEWAGAGLDAVFCQRSNVFSPRLWRMIFDIIRFNQFALDLLRADEAGAGSQDSVGSEETIGSYLEREGYSDVFRDDYLIPMTAAVWSTSPDKCTLDFPAITLVRFL